LRNRSAVLVLLFSSTLFAQTVRVPFVGCPSDGQVGPQEAPKGPDQVVQIKASAARRLALYTLGGGFGVLAPRNWYCFALYGSSGSRLFVAPRVIHANDLFPMAGSAVELEATEGGGSGTALVAEVWARVFPALRPLVQRLIDAGDLPAERYTFSPYPDDKLIVQAARLVRFQTPPHSEGLGTMGHFKANDDLIDGVAILQGQNPDLLMLRVRLPLKQRDLAPVIIQQLLLRERSDTR
jgi:hypothetical protein